MATDSDARNTLATDLRRLIAGNLTNDEFDDQYYSEWWNADDAAVAEIATFGWSQYSSDVLIAYKLRGRHAVSSEIRRMAARAILFLQTDLDYEWPRDVKGIVPFWCFFGPGFYLLIGIVLLTHASLSGAVSTTLFGLLALIPAIHWATTHYERAEQVQWFQASGDLAIWPFIRQRDFDEAKRHPKYLAGRSTTQASSNGGEAPSESPEPHT